LQSFLPILVGKRRRPTDTNQGGLQVTGEQGDELRNSLPLSHPSRTPTNTC